MNTADAPGPRIDAAKTAATALVAGLPGDARLGLMTYGTSTGSAPEDKAAGCRDVRTLMPLGVVDRDRVDAAIDGIVASGYTPLSLALQRAVAQLPADASAQAVVVVSDGEGTCDVSPCDTAKQLKTQRPGLTISTVGFRLDGGAGGQLRCIAQATGGLFVTADNTEQLTARLQATQDLGRAESALTAGGLGGVELGQGGDEIRGANPDFPAVAAAGRVTVQWRDCDWTFADGRLTEIAPHNGGRTIDGVEPGTPLSRVGELYGKPLAVETDGHGGYRVTYAAGQDGDAAYRLLIEGYNDSGGTISGTVKTIVLCTCKPHSGSGATTSATPVARFDGYGPVRIGMTEAEVTTAMGSPRRHPDQFGSCVILGADNPQQLRVWVAVKTHRVTRIDTPAGTVTDRGVGDGSTPAQIRAAYSEPRYTVDQGPTVSGGGTPGINVFDGPADYTALGWPGETRVPLLGFASGADGRIQSLSIGVPPGWEGC